MAPLMALHGKPPPDERSQRLIRWSAIRDRLMRRVRRSAVQATADRRAASMAALLPAPSHPDEDQREGDEVNSASDVDSDDSLSWMGQPPSALAIAAAARSGPGTLPCVVGSENAGVSVFGIPTHLMPAGPVPLKSDEDAYEAWFCKCMTITGQLTRDRGLAADSLGDRRLAADSLGTSSSSSYSPPKAGSAVLSPRRPARETNHSVICTSVEEDCSCRLFAQCLAPTLPGTPPPSRRLTYADASTSMVSPSNGGFPGSFSPASELSPTLINDAAPSSMISTDNIGINDSFTHVTTDVVSVSDSSAVSTAVYSDSE